MAGQEFDPVKPSQLNEDDPFGPVKAPKQKVTPPPEQVNSFHSRSDVDSSWQAQHHTLGIKHDQAAAGDHKHDGNSSRMLMENETISGSTGGNVALQNLITALANALGFTDNTT